jgi:hypothetical protein
MRNRLLWHSLLSATVVALVGCNSDIGAAPTVDESIAPLFRAGGPHARPTAWADAELFDVLVPPATFDNPQGNFDELYAGGNGFLDGVPLISDSKPGDRDYNGGRWHLNVLKAGVDPDKYAAASSAEDLDPADFESTEVYFECPMLPRTGAGGR